MSWDKHDYDHIPGTYVFNGERSSQGYNINKMAFSFNESTNREAFVDDMDAYCRKFQLSDEARAAVLEGDFLGLMRLGGNIYYLAKIAIFHGYTVQDAGAQMGGISTEEFKAKLSKNSEGFEQKLTTIGGYFHG
jgi:protocatechuate 4,5-dioxygenase alpha chain